jgi:hypothetical protein
MALFATKPFTNANQYIADLQDFAEANGWVIDFFGTMNNNNRLHLHKGSSHFEVWYYNAARIVISGCAGYNPGADSNNQPNAHPGGITHLPGSGAVEAYFVSSGQSLYFGVGNSSGPGKQPMWGGLCTITHKIGSWSGGLLITGGDQFATNSSSRYFFADNGSFASLYFNGAWTPKSQNGANGLYGRLINHENAFTDATQPAAHNLGIVPMRVPFFIRNTANAGLVHPLGFAPGIVSCGPGTLYNLHEIIDIGGVPHLWTFQAAAAWFLFRLEA